MGRRSKAARAAKPRAWELPLNPSLLEPPPLPPLAVLLLRVVTMSRSVYTRRVCAPRHSSCSSPRAWDTLLECVGVGGGVHSTVHRRSEEAALMASHFKGVRVSTRLAVPAPAAAAAMAVAWSPGRESAKVVGRGFKASIRESTLFRMEAHKPFVLEGEEELVEELEEEEEEEEEGVGGTGEEEKPEEPPPPPTAKPPAPPPPPLLLLLPEPPPLPLPLPPPIPPEGEDSSVESFPTRASTARVECRSAVGTTATTAGAAAAPVLAPEAPEAPAPRAPAKVCRHLAKAGQRGASG
jgi:hypothetical protein